MSVYYQGDVKQLDKESIIEINHYINRANTVHELDPMNMDKFNIVLGTSQENHVHLTIMGILKESGLNALYMQTNRQSQKIKNIMNQKITEISITNGRGFLIMECETSILDDLKLKKQFWEDWFYEYHKEGYLSQDYVLLKFIPKVIRVFI